MKKKEWIMVIAILMIAGVLWGISVFCMDDSGAVLRITVDNEIYGEYPLDNDQIIEINQTNVCEIVDGTVKMIMAQCPDQLCVKTHEITEQGEMIICLPNRVFLEVVSKNEDTLPDTIAS